MDLVAPLLLLCLVAIPLLYQTGFLSLPEKWKSGQANSGSRPPISGGKRKMIIITDVWVDDADALILALSHKDVEVLVIATSFGDVKPTQIIANANRVLGLFPDKNVPVYAGAERPLNPPTDYKHAWEDKDNDGLDDNAFAGLEESERNAAVSGKTAADAMFETIRDNPGCIIVCLAPLTDLAWAIRKHQGLETNSNLKHVYIMGGNIPATGENSMKPAYNFRQDPDAANYVFTRLKRPISHHPGVTFEEQYMNEKTTKRGQFVQAIRPAFLKAVGKPTLSDELGMTIAIDPLATIEDSKKVEKFVKVKLTGTSKGQLVVDETSAKRGQNMRFVVKFNQAKVEQMLLESLK